MDPYNYLEHLLDKKYNKISNLPIQNYHNNACTHIIFEAIKKGDDLVNYYFNNEYKFREIYTQIIIDGEQNRKKYGEHIDGDDPTDLSIIKSYPEINKNIEGGYKSKIYAQEISTDLNDLKNDFKKLTNNNKFMIIRRDGGTFLLLSITNNDNVLVIDTHYTCSGVLSFENVIKYIFHDGLYTGEYLFGVGSFVNKYDSIKKIENKYKKTKILYI